MCITARLIRTRLGTSGYTCSGEDKSRLKLQGGIDMNNNFLRSLEYSLQKGFIDKNISGSAKYKPQLLTNNIKESENVLSSLLEELTNCHSFIFSVAFITESGLATLKSYLY